jgi:hypothetical protein
MSRIFETNCHETEGTREASYPFAGQAVRQGHFA